MALAVGADFAVSSVVGRLLFVGGPIPRGGADDAAETTDPARDLELAVLDVYEWARRYRAELRQRGEDLPAEGREVLRALHRRLHHAEARHGRS